MKFRTASQRTANVDRFISLAEEQIGYTANADGTNVYGERVGYNGKGLPWDGAFIDVIARIAGLRWKSFIYTPQALSLAIKDGRCYNKPQRGDIVFFETSTVSTFGTPHVGIVIDTSRYMSDGVFTTVEAQTKNGQPKGSDLANGVYQRMRSSLEVLTFVRPNYDLTVPEAEAELTDGAKLPTINPAHIRPNLRSERVALIQMALAYVTDVRGLPRGHFDSKTRDAYAKFQRDVGIYPADGIPEINSLTRLASETKLFRAEA
jgi:hypothetical protein